MITLDEGKLSFTFPDELVASKYDAWDFYQQHFKNYFTGTKAVDFVVYEAGERTLWLLEVKDYRGLTRTKPIDLCDEIAAKVRDTLAGLLTASVADAHDRKQDAIQAITARKIRVVLHLEGFLPNADKDRGANKLPSYRASLYQKLKQQVKPLDPHPLIVELNDARTPWSSANHNR